MEEGLLKQFRNLVEEDKVKFYHKLLVFLFFVFVATIFWFLSALNRNYISDIQYPVRYTNLPAGKVLVNDLPGNLSLKVSGHGYTLLRHRLSKQLLPLIFDVNSFALSSIEDTVNQSFYVLSRVAQNKIAGQLSNEIQILEIQPDSIVFVFSDIARRKLPVKPMLDLQFERQFMVKGKITATPDSVEVEGPKSVIDTMQFAYSAMTRIGNIRGTVEKSLEFRELDQVRYGEKKINVRIPAEQFTESSIKIPIVPVNVPEGLTLKLFPAEITLFYMVALSDYERISAANFTAVADYSLLEGLMPPKIRIQLGRTPDNIFYIRHFPESVDYIIER